MPVTSYKIRYNSCCFAVLAPLMVAFSPSSALAAPCGSDGSGGVNNAGGACEVSGGTNRITADNGPGNPIEASNVMVTVPFGTAVSALNGSSVVFGANAVVQDTGGGGFVGLLADGAGSVIDASSHGLEITLPGAADAVRASNGGQVLLGAGTVIDVTPTGGSRVLYAVGTDSLITATGATFIGTTWGGDRIAHAENGGWIQITDSDITLATGGGGVSSVEANGAGSRLLMNNVNISATGSGGNAVGMLATNGAFMSLTGGSVNVVGGGGSTALRASGAGTILSVANPAISLIADNSAAMDIQDGATISVTGGSVTSTGTNSVGMRISGGGPNTNRLNMQNASLNSTSDSFRVEGGSIADITIRNMNITNNNNNLLSVDGDVEFTTSAVNMRGRILTVGGSNYVDLGNFSVWTVTGNSNMTGLENTTSTIAFAAPTGNPLLLSSYKTITVGTRDYNSNFGDLIINTYLGADASPSDRLIIDGAGSAAMGVTWLTVNNTTGTGEQTISDGILVVDAQGGATTQANAFRLASSVRAGAYDYFLFRGSLDGANTEDWFLRSTFTVNPPGPPPVVPPSPVVPVLPPRPMPLPPGWGGGGGGGGGGTLPPGTYPIIGPELPAYGVAHPMALTAGLTVLGTMHERIGDTLTRPNLGDDATSQGWGRLLAQEVDHRYAAFANPTAEGHMLGFQAGKDIFRHESEAGDRDAAGLYLAYVRSDMRMDGLVTNADATGYVRTHVGSMDLNGYSLAGYWTHYGADEWYINGVVQGTYYRGDTQTPNAKLPLRGGGFLTSLEAGYPVKLPLGRNFVLEPQVQGIWQYVNFDAQDDGKGMVDPGVTRMTTGRIGLRGQWTVPSEDGTVWQPYLRLNYWRDWGKNAVTRFDDDPVPLVIRGQRMEYAGGLSVKTSEHLSFYAQAGVQHGLSEADYESHRALVGNAGLRYAW